MRITWDEYFLKCMDAAALRASCDRGKSACIIVKDNRILATGYVGAPSGLPSCDEVGHQIIARCELEMQTYNEMIQENEGLITKSKNLPFSLHCIRTVHAEQNAIINCARNGVSTLGSTLYVTMTPCAVCARMIIQAGITKVIARNKYQKDAESRFLLGLAGIELVILEEKELY
jgi:dCMP deaminase